MCYLYMKLHHMTGNPLLRPTYVYKTASHDRESTAQTHICI